MTKISTLPERFFSLRKGDLSINSKCLRKVKPDGKSWRTALVAGWLAVFCFVFCTLQQSHSAQCETSSSSWTKSHLYSKLSLTPTRPSAFNQGATFPLRRPVTFFIICKLETPKTIWSPSGFSRVLQPVGSPWKLCMPCPLIMDNTSFTVWCLIGSRRGLVPHCVPMQRYKAVIVVNGFPQNQKPAVHQKVWKVGIRRWIKRLDINNF